VLAECHAGVMCQSNQVMVVFYLINIRHSVVFFTDYTIKASTLRSVYGRWCSEGHVGICIRPSGWK